MIRLYKKQKPSKIFIIIISIIVLTSADLYAQNFVKITDNNNPVVSDIFSGNYFGSSWMDIDNDGRLDLYVNRKAVYRNLGGGNFVKLQTALGDQTANLSNT
ncbi:MAG: VCBS repeat-containing protein [bacterium]|nr:VCBS repeat-containing protein [bacterium]